MATCAGVGAPRGDQTLAHVKRRNGVSAADLDRPARTFANNQSAKGFSFGQADADRKYVMRGAIQARNDGSVSCELL
jgi:hypothetical protein